MIWLKLFNEYFTNIAQTLAREVLVAEDEPEYYYSSPTDCTFSLHTLRVDTVFNLLKEINVKKATGLDMIPSKSVKMAAGIVGRKRV